MKEIKVELPSILISVFILAVFSFTFINANNYYTININDNVDSLTLYNIDNIEYIDLNVFVSALNLKSFFKRTQESFRIESDNSYAILSINSPFYRGDGKIFKMSFSPIYYNDLMLFPIYSIKQIFSKLLTSNASINNHSIIIKEQCIIKNIIEKEKSIDIVFNHLPKYETNTTLREVILFINKCSTDNKNLSQKKKTGLLRVLEIISDNNDLTFILTYEPKMKLDYIDEKGDTLKLFFKKRQTPPSGNNTMEIKTIIIDAGHGGKDPGAIGPTGLKEKTVVLDVSFRLKELITANLKNIKVIMTRTTDKYVSLKDRTMLANKYPNAIFVSIHCNASHNKNAKGAEMYFLSTAKTDWARAVEARENASLAFDISTKDKKGLDFILWDLAQNEFLTESSNLAELIQGFFESNTNNPRGLNQAGFYVLKGNYMPAVLVEAAFISNKAEEKLLKTADFRKKIAKNIFNGIKKFLSDYEKKNQ